MKSHNWWFLSFYESEPSIPFHSFSTFSVVGQALKIALSGRKIAVDPDLAEEIKNLQSLAQKSHVKQWEKMHVDAVTKLTEG